MNELYYSRELLEEARGEISELAFGKAAALTGHELAISHPHPHPHPHQ